MVDQGGRDHAGRRDRRRRVSGRSCPDADSAVICDAETVVTASALLPPASRSSGRLETTLAARRLRRVPDRSRPCVMRGRRRLASTGQAEAIVAVTRQGKTAQYPSRRPPRASDRRRHSLSDLVARRLMLYWGVRPVVSHLRGRPARPKDPSGSAFRSAACRGRPHQHQSGPEPSRRELPGTCKAALKRRLAQTEDSTD